jgi:hypothetical protein
MTQLNYLGDTYKTNPESLDVYYDSGDIKRDYRVMGKLSGKNIGIKDLNEIKDDMIAEAQKKGADGILFLHFDTFEESHSVFADLIHYN